MGKRKRSKRKSRKNSNRDYVKTAGGLALVGIGTAVAVRALRGI